MPQYDGTSNRPKKKLSDVEYYWHVIAETIGCSVIEAKSKITPQEFYNWIEYFKYSPPLKDHINNAQANICYTLAAINRGRNKKATPFNKFLLDYKEASKTDAEKTIDKINKFFGGLANGKK